MRTDREVAVTYDGFLEQVGSQIDALPPRPRAAMFWVAGMGLVNGLPLVGTWADWFPAAQRIGRRFILTGEDDAERSAAWIVATETPGYDNSQMLNSAIICASSPLAVAAEPDVKVGHWFEHALFPLMQDASLHLFDDVSFPAEVEELDEAFLQQPTQVGAAFVLHALAVLEEQAHPDPEALRRLADEASVLAPRNAADPG